MKQILSSLKTGKTDVIDVPCPQLKAGHVLIRTHVSLISKGTEKMLIDFGHASLLQKAKQQPERVSMVWDKIKTDGLAPTLDAVRNKLDQLIPMGYCNVGTVLAVADDVTEIKIGDRVISNGAHAEVVTVGKNLCCLVPAHVVDEDAVFTILGAVALQGIRLVAPTLGETVVVMGLGLVGLLTVQLLYAQGCTVIGIDLDPKKVALANTMGANAHLLTSSEEALLFTQQLTRERGVDAVLVTASTKSSNPIHLAAQMCRQRGRIVLVGVTGLELSRQDFYAKELTFQVSCSYGPGRYDPAYEVTGLDYPIGFVRWTEKRNFEAFLDLLAQQKLNMHPLITHRFSIEDAESAYQSLASSEEPLGVLLQYPQIEQVELENRTVRLTALNPKQAEKVTIGVVGAGNYASRVLIPIIKKQAVTCHTIACSHGISGAQTGKKYGFQAVTTDVNVIFNDAAINTVVIASRHDTHAKFIAQAIQAKKHIFVEKPFCLSLAELNELTTLLSCYEQNVMVGFNRRFAPQIQIIKKLLDTQNSPINFIMTVNAGQIPSAHWTNQPNIGGGRIIGEACHFIDLLYYLANASIHGYQVTGSGLLQDNATITLQFANGSIGTIHYFPNGHRRLIKERLDIFVNGKVLQLENFRKLKGYGWKQFNHHHLWRQDKGQQTCMRDFINSIEQGKSSPIPLAEILEVSKITIEIANCL